MNGLEKIGAIFAIILISIGALAFGLFLRGCNTASEMADKTIFNADKNVWTYEEFHRQYEQYQQYELQLKEAEEKIEKLEAEGTTSSQRYDNLAMEADGVRQMMRRIAANYNAASEIAYQGIWKSKGLPEKLGQK